MITLVRSIVMIQDLYYPFSDPKCVLRRMSRLFMIMCGRQVERFAIRETSHGQKYRGFWQLMFDLLLKLEKRLRIYDTLV